MTPHAFGQFIKRAADALGAPGGKPASLPPKPAASSEPFVWKPALSPAPISQPSALGKTLGYLPSTSPRAQIGRWYENAGGFNKAVSSAQTAMQNRTPGVLNSNTWPTWNAGRVDRSFPVATTNFQDKTQLGEYSPAHNAISISENVSEMDEYQPTLEHELTHGILSPNVSTALRARVSAGLVKKPTGLASWIFPSVAATPTDVRWKTPDLAAKIDTGSAGQPDAEFRNYFNYLLDPAETDVRLAEIKRQYAHQTGTLVETPEQARDAWNWFQQNKGMLSPEMTLKGEDFDMYNALPAEQKEQMFHRMPELVRNNNQSNAYKFGQCIKRAVELDELQPQRKKPKEAPNYTPYILSALAAGIPAALLAGKFLRAGTRVYNSAQNEAQRNSVNSAIWNQNDLQHAIDAANSRR